eukprot:3388383-Pleurochrysis_carterae.AAC.1
MAEAALSAMIGADSIPVLHTSSPDHGQLVSRSGICVRRIVVVLVMLHFAAILRLLQVDAMREPFTAILGPADLRAQVRTVVLMHHKRLPELNATLHGLANVSKSHELHVIVTQALPTTEMQAAEATSKMLREVANQLPFRLEHKPAEIVAANGSGDGSYSVDAARFGTKKNSLRNMLNGLKHAFDEASKTAHAPGSDAEAAPALRSVIVMEDDVEVSVDIFNYFDFAFSRINAARALPMPQASTHAFT